MSRITRDSVDLKANVFVLFEKGIRRLNVDDDTVVRQKERISLCCSTVASMR